MPIPFILGALAAGAGAYGLKKGYDAKKDMDKAQKINNKAQEIARDTENTINRVRNNTNQTIELLGKTKIEILTGSLNDFVESFSRLKNVELSDSVGMEELRGFNPNSRDFIDIKNASFNAKELASGTAGSLAAGTLAAVGAYSAAGTIGVASTGAAIAGLSGAAATNATLAWLGGGALSAGGFGMAGGMAVLGGIVAGPALAIGGAFMASKAEKALNDARSNLDQAHAFQEQGENICSVLNAIQDRAIQIKDLLDELDYRMSRAVSEVDNIIYDFGTDYRKLNRSAKEEIGIAAQIAKTIKIVLDTPLLNEDGELNDYDTYNLIEDTQDLLNSGKI